MQLLIKIVFSLIIILLAASAAKRFPTIAGLIGVMPLTGAPRSSAWRNRSIKELRGSKSFAAGAAARWTSPPPGWTLGPRRKGFGGCAGLIAYQRC